MTCAICGCRMRRVAGTLRHYGAFGPCDRITALRACLARIEQRLIEGVGNQPWSNNEAAVRVVREEIARQGR